MAKLSAHGQELVRLEKSKDIAGPYGYGEGKSTTNWERTSYAFFEDSWVLKKRDVRFVEEDGRITPHSYGWKRYAKLKDSPDSLKLSVDSLLGKGFIKV